MIASKIGKLYLLLCNILSCNVLYDYHLSDYPLAKQSISISDMTSVHFEPGTSCDTLTVLPSGVYWFDQSKITFSAFCDQEVDQGGWMVGFTIIKEP